MMSHELQQISRWLIVIFVTTTVTLVGRGVQARVSRIEIIERKLFANGKPFGEVGPYEFIRGRLNYAVQPDHPRNRAIVDLQLAKQGRLRADLSSIVDGHIVEVLGPDPRNDKGEVQFAGDFILLKPIDLSRGNHRLLYDVNNRGNLLMLSYYNNSVGSNRPMTEQHAGNGWLMRHGYSLLWSAWNWDVAKVGQSPLRINLPIVVKQDGSPMTDLVNAELAVQSQDGITVEWISWGGSRCYPVAEEAIEEAVLTVRSDPDGKRKLIPRDQWQFAVITPGGKPRFNPVHVYLSSGFHKGQLYELVYTAKHPRVVGLGLAAVRDAISFFHFESEDKGGRASPLAVDGHADPQFAYIFGISQSGRFTTHMIFQGFHVDEQDRLVFEGARPHVAGAGKGGFNYRFAQTTHHPKHLQGNYFPADHFPFHFTPDDSLQHDQLGQPDRMSGDVLAVAKRLNKIPKVQISNHEGEYWTRSASLLHTDVLGETDAKLHPFVRVYMINGARHGTPSQSSRRRSFTAQHAMNQLDPRPIGRALLVALDRWVSEGIEPPRSRVPRIDRDELITPTAHRDRFPQIPSYNVDGLEFPAPRLPGVNLRPPRVDYGPRFWTEGIQDVVPPRYYGPRFVTLVPAIDEDGNPVGGIRLPWLAEPLGTYQGFNPRLQGTGSENYLKAFDSSFWPLATTRTKRLQNRDPRPSIEERYSDKSDYVRRVARATEQLRKERFLLDEDATAIVDFARQMAWPPRPIDRWPFWALDE